jgi:flagellar assembly protein FliH
LLAGFEPTAEQVMKLCEETLSQLYPERDNLELFLCPRDAALLEQLAVDWKTRHPGLRVIVDAALGPADCQVRSRFGLTDARRQAKLEALTRELLSA